MGARSSLPFKVKVKRFHPAASTTTRGWYTVWWRNAPQAHHAQMCQSTVPYVQHLHLGSWHRPWQLWPRLTASVSSWPPLKLIVGAPARVINISAELSCMLTAPITRGDSGKARGGQVRCWPGVTFSPAHLLERDRLMGIPPCVMGIPPCLVDCMTDGLRTSSVYPSSVVHVSCRIKGRLDEPLKGKLSLLFNRTTPWITALPFHTTKAHESGRIEALLWLRGDKGSALDAPQSNYSASADNDLATKESVSTTVTHNAWIFAQT